MSGWKREIKKEEKKDEIRYTKRKKKEAIIKSLQQEAKRSKNPAKLGGMKSVESDVKHAEEALIKTVRKRKK
ncbi:MAG: hypothetical protein ACP5UZ_02985 [Thermoplasmata archaeon]